MEEKKTGVLFSGGKDSCLALHKAGRVDCLLSVLPESRDSWMFHQPDLKLLKKQAEMLGLPLIIQKSSKGKERELEDLKELIRKSKVDKIVIGGIASSYQGNRVKKICSELGIEVEAPLWSYDDERLWKELLGNGFKVIITKISCEGLGKEFIGKIIGKKELAELKKLAEKYKFRLDFEGGEAETAVLFMPGFRKEIKIKFDVKSEGSYRHFIVLKEARS